MEARRWLAAGAAHGGGAWGPLRRLSRKLGEPAPTFVLFNGVLLVGHLPVLFNAMLHSVWLHVAEHTMFFVTGADVLEAGGPLAAAARPAQRGVQALPLSGRGDGGQLGAGAGDRRVGDAAVLRTTPTRPSRPGGISALADQHLAAGVMWVPGSISFTIVFLVYVYRWLTPQAPAPLPATRLAGHHR